MNAETVTINPALESAGNPQTGKSALPDWREQVRVMHLGCAVQWQVSADYWRREAAKYVVAENWVMAAEALFNATIREEYVAEDLRKADVGWQLAEDGKGVYTNFANSHESIPGNN